jgi:hypothetical protein
MVGGVDLDCWPDLRPVTDRHFDHVEDHAVEVEEHARADRDIEPVVAEERRPDFGVLADTAQPLEQKRTALVRQGHVVPAQPLRCCGSVGLDLWNIGAIQLARKHLVTFGTAHGVCSLPHELGHRAIAT